MSTQPCSYARMLLLKAMDPPLMQHPSTFLDCDTFEKQVVHLLGCSLDTVTRQQYDDLVSESESTWPCHQQSFIKSVKEYIHSFGSNVQPNPNVQPSSATSVATSATIPDDSNHVTDGSVTPECTNDGATPSIPTSDPSAPTFSPFSATIGKPAISTRPRTSAHATTLRDSEDTVPCHEPAQLISPVPANPENFAQSSSHISLNQCNSHIRKTTI